MSDPQGARWRAIAAGMLLLAGAGIMNGARVLAAKSLAGGSAGPSEQVRVATAIRAKLPQVDEPLSERIAASVVRCQREQSLAPDLVLAVLAQESSGRPEARSSAGAIGLMQVMPYMYEELALPGGVAHVEANIEAGCRLLADNIRRLGEDEGISAYCWGNQIGNDRYLLRVKKLRRDFRPYLVPGEAASSRISG